MIKYFIMILIFSFISQINAQSDLQIVNDFKNATAALERKLVNATEIKVINAVKNEIAKIKRDYLKHKELLDGALYPENFNSSFDKLNTKIAIAIQKVSKKESLEQEIVELKDEVKNLKSRNSKLIADNDALYKQLTIFKAGRKAGHNVIDSLKRTITQLRRNLKSRDDLLVEIFDSLFFDVSMQVMNFNRVEKKDISVRMKNIGLLENIQKNISDNIRLIESGEVDGSDLIALRDNYLGFKDKWDVFGANLTKIYTEDKHSSAKLAEINSMIFQWDTSFDSQIWPAINSYFANYQIEITPFNNSDEFKSSILNYLDSEIENKFNRDSDEMLNVFSLFNVNIWDEKIALYWLPLLVDRGYLTKEDINEFENKINNWEDKLPSASSDLYYYGVIFAILLAAIVIVFTLAFRRRD